MPGVANANTPDFSPDSVVPRLRLTRNITGRPSDSAHEDAELPPSPSSSSSTISRRNTTVAALAARASSDASPAARLRALTNRVYASVPSGSQSTPPPTDPESQSDQETVLRPLYGAATSRALPYELESDVESMVEHSMRPPQAASAKKRLRDLYQRTLGVNEPENSPEIMSSPRIRRSSLTPPATHKTAPRRLSLSDEEAEHSVNRSNGDGGPRNGRKQGTSLDVLRARLELSDVEQEALDETPARSRTVHPLQARLDSVNLSEELPNPTPRRLFPNPATHASFARQAPIGTSTPRHDRNDTNSLATDDSFGSIPSFRPSYLRPLTLDSPSPRSTSPAPPVHQSLSLRVKPRPTMSLHHQVPLKDDESDDPAPSTSRMSIAQSRLGSFADPLVQPDEVFTSPSRLKNDAMSSSTSSRAANSHSLNSREPSHASRPVEEDQTDQDPENVSVDLDHSHSKENSSITLSRHVGGYSRLLDNTPDVPRDISGSQHSVSMEDVENPFRSASRSNPVNKSIDQSYVHLSKEEPRSLKADFSAASHISVQHDTEMEEATDYEGSHSRINSSLFRTPEESLRVSMRSNENRPATPPTPPSPSSSVPLPPSPTYSPSKRSGTSNTFSDSRDAERLRKAGSAEPAATHPARGGMLPGPSSPPLTGSPTRKQDSPAITAGEPPNRVQDVPSASLRPAQAMPLDEDSLSISHMSFATPPRRAPSTPVFRTPPRPQDLPDLPDPPSSPEAMASPISSKVARNSVLPKRNLMTPRTPRPPGAWMNTPAPNKGNQTLSSSIIEADDTALGIDLDPAPATPAPVTNGLWGKSRQSPSDPVTPTNKPKPKPEPEPELVTDQPVANSSALLPPKTPAPPGAWAATPAPNSLRKGILKVRFDETSVASREALQKMEELSKASANGDTSGSPIPHQGHGHSRKPLPKEFGGKGGEGALSERSPNNSMRKRRSRLKMVDEFGNALDEKAAGEHGATAEDDGPASPEEIRGLRAVARAIPALDDEFTEESMSLTVPAPLTSLADQIKDKERQEELRSMSRSARHERAKLERQLQLLRNGEGDLRTKLSRLRAAVPVSQSQIESGPPHDPATGRSRWLWTMVALELFVFWLVLRFTASRAEYLFLTTHYDPFYPALYGPSSLPALDVVHHHFLPSDLGGPILSGGDFGWLIRRSFSIFLHDMWHSIFSIFAFAFGSNSSDLRLPSPDNWVPS